MTKTSSKNCTYSVSTGNAAHCPDINGTWRCTTTGENNLSKNCTSSNCPSSADAWQHGLADNEREHSVEATMTTVMTATAEKPLCKTLSGPRHTARRKTLSKNCTCEPRHFLWSKPAMMTGILGLTTERKTQHEVQRH